MLTKLRLNLGSSLYRTGQLSEALESYRLAKDSTVTPSLRGAACPGLVMTLRALGRTHEAEVESVESLRLLTEPEHALLAKHNYAVVQADTGKWLSARDLFEELVRAYQQCGDIVRQAAALEEVARCCLHLGRLSLAEEACWRAVGLLEQSTSWVTKARCYRMLGQIAMARKEFRSAQQWLRMSLDLSQRLGASEEVRVTMRVLEEAMDQLESDSGPTCDTPTL